MRRIAPFDPNDRKQLEDIQRMLMLRAEKARESLPDFFEFVMREQTTKRPMKCAPHQRVGFAFAEAHPRCCMIWPAGASKTFVTVAQTLFLLGKDCTSRGAIISKTQELAKKTISVVTDYIDTSHELRLVFPRLKRSKGSWRDDRIVVDRPAGIPDASLVALGIGGSILGSRLNWAIVDDILDLENTSTPDMRKKTIDFVFSSVISRMDPNGRVIVNNTAWHPEDLVHFLSDPRKGAWPSLRMTITGDVHVGDDPYRIRAGEEPWDHELLAPKYEDGVDYTCRLKRPNIDDTNHDVPLFPERFFYSAWEVRGVRQPPAANMQEAIERARVDIDNKRREFVLPGEFNRAFMGIARDDNSQLCQQAYIDTCKEAAFKAGYYSLVSKYEGPNPTFTGVDLAVGLGEQHDDTVFFTFEVLPDRRRRILDIEIGKWPGPVIVDKMIKKQKAYNSVVRVENNGAQDFLRQQVLNLDKTLPIKAHTTGRTKAHPEYGVPGGFTEMANGAWLIPNDRNGNVHPFVQSWIEGCLYYVAGKHTHDAVMAWYFAREQAKAWGLLAPLPKDEHGNLIPDRGNKAAGSVISGIMSR